MESVLYSNLSPKKFTEIILDIISRTMFDMNNRNFFIPDSTRVGSKDMNKEYRHGRIVGRLIVNVGPYKIGEHIKIYIDCNNIIVKSTKLTKDKHNPISYIVYPELPVLKQIIKEENKFFIPGDVYSYSTHMRDIKLLFEFIPYFGDPYVRPVISKIDSVNIKRGQKYWINIEKDKGIRLYDDKGEFISYLTIDYIMPKLIEKL